MQFRQNSIHDSELLVDGSLSTLDLKTILDSGYLAMNAVRKPDLLHPRPAVNLTHRFAGSEPIRLHMYLDIPRDRRVVRSFPYVDERQRLRLWDVDENEPFRVVGHGVIDGGLPPELVRKRFPKLFAWAQNRGYWTDVNAS